MPAPLCPVTCQKIWEEIHGLEAHSQKLLEHLMDFGASDGLMDDLNLDAMSGELDWHDMEPEDVRDEVKDACIEPTEELFASMRKLVRLWKDVLKAQKATSSSGLKAFRKALAKFRSYCEELDLDMDDMELDEELPEYLREAADADERKELIQGAIKDVLDLGNGLMVFVDKHFAAFKQHREALVALLAEGSETEAPGDENERPAKQPRTQGPGILEAGPTEVSPAEIFDEI